MSGFVSWSNEPLTRLTDERARRPGLPARAAFGRPHGPPAGKRDLAAGLSVAAARGQLRGPEGGDASARFSDQFLRRLRAGGAVHPGRSIRDDERWHRSCPRHPDRVPQPSLADPDAWNRAACRPARRGRDVGRRPSGRLSERRSGSRRATRVWVPRRAGALCLRDSRLARLRRARRLRGAAHRLRRGGAEPLPGLFCLPLPFLDEHSAEPDLDHLVPGLCDGEPGLLPARVREEPDHHRLGRRGARTRFRHRLRDRRLLARAGELGAAREDGADMRSLAVARAVAWRTLHNVFTNPSLFVPSLVFPLFFFTAFAGGLSSVQDVPGFDYKQGYTAFQFVFVLLQSAAFGGVFTGFGIARDFESGFARRLLLAAPHR